MAEPTKEELLATVAVCQGRVESANYTANPRCPMRGRVGRWTR